ncbi:hypothetical protein C8Q80DRAFT_448607 [Daedaleopsis nitida]|nr:hypothetical protein C8Q80DRAFT_448607 [Daedaleopsis nitida]
MRLAIGPRPSRKYCILTVTPLYAVPLTAHIFDAHTALAIPILFLPQFCVHCVSTIMLSADAAGILIILLFAIFAILGGISIMVILRISCFSMKTRNIISVVDSRTLSTWVKARVSPVTVNMNTQASASLGSHPTGDSMDLSSSLEPVPSSDDAVMQPTHFSHDILPISSLPHADSSRCTQPYHSLRADSSFSLLDEITSHDTMSVRTMSTIPPSYQTRRSEPDLTDRPPLPSPTTPKSLLDVSVGSRSTPVSPPPSFGAQASCSGVQVDVLARAMTNCQVPRKLRDGGVRLGGGPL